jgi:hypothetical protein
MIPHIAVLLLTSLALALSSCADPQVVQATDCRGAKEPCGLVFVTGTHAMSSQPVTVPVSAVPSLP